MIKSTAFCGQNRTISDRILFSRLMYKSGAKVFKKGSPAIPSLKLRTAVRENVYFDTEQNFILVIF